MLQVEFDVQPGNCVDILLPMIPTPQEVVERSALLGYDKALAEADAYWRQVPATAATIDVPEEEINRAIRSLSQDGRSHRREGPGHRASTAP